MAKRKQPKPPTDGSISSALKGSIISEEQGPTECAKPVAEVRLTTSGATGTMTGNLTVGDPNPAATTDLLTEEDQVLGAFWALLESDGYTVW